MYQPPTPENAKYIQHALIFQSILQPDIDFVHPSIYKHIGIQINQSFVWCILLF